MEDLEGYEDLAFLLDIRAKMLMETNKCVFILWVRQYIDYFELYCLLVGVLSYCFVY